jgi:very-short-patch-repair endonuclease
MGIDQDLAKRALEQRSLVTAADVAKAGGNRSHIRRRVQSGRWQRVLPGVYLIAGAPIDWTTRQLAAVLSAGPGAAASHLAAARLWEIPGFATAGIELSVPRHRSRRRKGQRIHESSDLDRCTIEERSGVPVTDASRTILDLARYVGPIRLHRSIEALRRREDLTWSSLIETLAQHARQGRHGVRRLRSVILAHAHREEITDTDMELLVLSLIREGGLPEPTLHHRVLDGDRFVAEVDLAYPEHRIAIECDGSIHLVEEVRDRDLTRQNDLILAGWTVLRFSYERLRTRPEAVLAEIRAALDAARAA